MSDAVVEPVETPDDELLQVPVERLAAMVREKRQAEAKTRERLRDTEAQRDALAGTVSGFQRQALQAAASAAGVLPTAMPDLDGAVTLTDLLGDDGLLDDGLVQAAFAAVKETRPHWFQGGPSRSGGDFTAGTATGYETAPATWSDVL